MKNIPDTMVPLSRGEMFVMEANSVSTDAVPSDPNPGDNTHVGYLDNWSVEDFIKVMARQSAVGKIDKNQGEEEYKKIFEVTDEGNAIVHSTIDAVSVCNPTGLRFTYKDGRYGFLKSDGSFFPLYKGDLV